MIAKIRSLFNMFDFQTWLIILMGVTFAPFAILDQSMWTQVLLLFVVSVFVLKHVLSSKTDKKDDDNETEKHEESRPKSELFILFMLFVLSSFISALFSSSFWYSFFDNFSVIDYLLLTLLLAMLFKIFVKRKTSFDISKLNLAFQVVFVFNLLYFSAAAFFGLAFFKTVTATVFTSVTELSVFVALLLLSSIINEAKGKVSKVFKYLTITLATLVLVVLNTYVAWMTLLSGLLLFLYFKIQKKSSTLKDKLLPALFVFLSIVFLLFGATISTYVYSTLGISFAEPRPSIIGSLEILNNSQTLNWHNKLFGTGPASFASDWFAYKSSPASNMSIYWDKTFPYASNTILHFIISMGWLTGIVWILLLLAIFSYIFRFAFSAKYKKLVNSEPSRLYVLLLAVTVSLLLYTPSIFVWVLFVLLLASFIVSLSKAKLLTEQKCKESKIKKLICKSATATVAGIAIYSSVMIVASSITIPVVAGYLKDSKFKEAKSIISTLAFLSPVKAVMYSNLANVSELELNSKLAKIKDEKELKKNKLSLLSLADEASRAYRKATQYNDKDFTLWLALANAEKTKYLLSKKEEDYKSALMAFAKANSLAPMHPLVSYAGADLMAAKGDIKAVKAELLRTINLKPDFDYAYAALFNIALSEKNMDEAIAIAQAAVSKQSNNPVAWSRLAAALYQNKQYKDAELAAKNAVKLYAQFGRMDLNTLYILAFSMQKQGKTEEALKILNEISQKAQSEKILELIKSIQSTSDKEDKKADSDNSDEESKSTDKQDDKKESANDE